MQSQAKQTAIVGRDGIAASARGDGGGKRGVDTVEVDATFGRLLGLAEGLKVCEELDCLHERCTDVDIVGWRGVAFGSTAGTYGQH